LINAFQLPSAFLASVSVVCQLLRHSSSFSIHHWQGNVKSLLFHRGNQHIWNSRPCGKIHWRTIPFSSSAAGDSTNQSAVFVATWPWNSSNLGDVLGGNDKKHQETIWNLGRA
jgi:hypothetical protein